jgi:ribosomal protein S18 acetylase RimI-like enzyme
MAITIRPGTAADIDGAHACLDIVARERRFLATLEAPALGLSRQFWLRMIAQDDTFLVALDRQQVIGWCDITRAAQPPYRHSGTLGMGLLPEHRGVGVGRKLLAAALDSARHAGFERVELSVFADNGPAIGLYRAIGFQLEGIRRRYRKLDGAFTDGLIMAILLEATQEDDA